MRILQVINSLTTGGAEKLLVDTLKNYDYSNLEVDLLLLRRIDSSLLKELGTFNRVKIIYTYENLSVYNPMHILEIMKIIERYDLVHVHLFPANYWVSIAKLLKQSQTPIVLTEHSTNNRRRNNFFLRIVDRIIYKQFNIIVAISEVAKITLTKHLGVKFQNIITINNGIDLNIIKVATKYSHNELGFKNTDILILQVSSFRYPKDQKTVIRALQQLDSKYHLLFAGEGNLLNENKELSVELNVSDRVHFLGNRTDIPKLLKSCDLIILSSKYEGLSLSSIEGMYSGNPFIASNVPGLREVVKNAGLLFEYGDFKELSRIILRITHDDDLKLQIVDNCINRAEKYNIKNMICEYFEVYSSILNSSFKKIDELNEA